MEIALRHLRDLVDRAPAHQRGVKVYHHGPDSYSWYDLMSEVGGRTDLGRRWVGTLVSAARHENQDLGSYLKSAQE